MASAPLPKWTTFLEVDENKTTFSLFMSTYFENNAPPALQDQQRLILTGGYENGAVTKLVMHTTTAEIPDMQTTQLESDCRMMCMANHMDKEFAQNGSKGNIIMYSTDTDVLVLACHLGDWHHDQI